MFIIVDEADPSSLNAHPYKLEVRAVYDPIDGVRTAQDAAEHYAETSDAETVTVWTVPHIRTFRFRSEVRLRLIEDD